MGSAVPLSWLIIATLSSACVAALVAAFWTRVSASTRPPKRPESPPPIPNSALASLQADQAELYSQFEKMAVTVKRLSSRHAMRDRRDSPPDAPPVGTSKADLLRHYGMSGKVGPEFARAQQELELRQRDAGQTH